MSIASQDYRDGVAFGAQELRRRIESIREWGVTPDMHELRAMADNLQSLYGGRELQPAAVVTLSNDEIETALRKVPNIVLSMDAYDALAGSVGAALDAKSSDLGSTGSES